MDNGWSDMLSSTLHSPYSLFAAIVKVVYFLNAPAPSSPFSLFSHYCWAPRGSSLLVPSAQNINTQLSVKGSTYLRSFVECWSQQMPHHQHTWLAKNIMPRLSVFLKIETSFCPKKWILFSKDSETTEPFVDDVSKRNRGYLQRSLCQWCGTFAMVTVKWFSIYFQWSLC